MDVKKFPQNKIVSILADQYTVEKIILFGSHARGDAHKDSDIDLVVIKKPKRLF